MFKNLKWVIKNLLIGVIVLYIVNFFGVEINIFVPINIITIIIVGFLRVPGLIILLILTKL
jgi:inhibitor of the pro-sigma K processing machinery